MNKKLGFEQKSDNKLFAYLGIKYGTAMIDDEDVGDLWTRDDLNRFVGIAAKRGVDIMTVGVPFIQMIGERLVPNMGAIAMLIQRKDVGQTDLGGYSFKLCDTDTEHTKHGHFYNNFGQCSPDIDCLSDAISFASGMVDKGFSVESATRLLQQVLETDVPFNPPTAKRGGMTKVMIIDLVSRLG